MTLAIHAEHGSVSINDCTGVIQSIHITFVETHWQDNIEFFRECTEMRNGWMTIKWLRTIKMFGPLVFAKVTTLKQLRNQDESGTLRCSNANQTFSRCDVFRYDVSHRHL